MDIDEGLENRIKECALQSLHPDEFMALAKTRRYVYTRLQRILIHALLGITRERVEISARRWAPILANSGFLKKSHTASKAIKTKRQGAHNNQGSPLSSDTREPRSP
jgi:Predicted nucleotidyltransferase